jgi:hypothetical protein
LLLLGKKSNKPSTSKAAKTASKAKKRGGTAEEVEGKIMEFLFDMHLMKRLPIKETQVLAASGYARTDSSGYRDIMKKLTNQCGYVEKSKGEISLTDSGLKVMQSKCGNESGKLSNNKGVEEFYKTMIVKTNKGKASAAKLDIVWDLLSDRNAHSVQEIMEATGYARQDSTGYRAIMKGLKDCKLIESEGKSWKLNVQTAFPFPE